MEGGTYGKPLPQFCNRTIEGWSQDFIQYSFRLSLFFRDIEPHSGNGIWESRCIFAYRDKEFLKLPPGGGE